MDITNFKTRRSVRKYSDREVSRELLDSILEAAMKAPTCGNMQLYSVIVTRSEEGKKALAPAHFNQPMVTQAPSGAKPLTSSPSFFSRLSGISAGIATFSCPVFLNSPSMIR